MRWTKTQEAQVGSGPSYSSDCSPRARMREGTEGRTVAYMLQALHLGAQVLRDGAVHVPFLHQPSLQLPHLQGEQR